MTYSLRESLLVGPRNNRVTNTLRKPAGNDSTTIIKNILPPTSKQAWSVAAQTLNPITSATKADVSHATCKQSLIRFFIVGNGEFAELQQRLRTLGPSVTLRSTRRAGGRI